MVEATLLYIIKDGKTLLIMKKKKIGAGLWNGPGGRVEKGESIEEAAVRETIEETGLKPKKIKYNGCIDFYIAQENDIDWKVHIFAADDFDGKMKETDEAAPKWFDVDKIPYDNMMPDDRIWMPLLLEGKKFDGKFYLDKECKEVLAHSIFR